MRKNWFKKRGWIWYPISAEGGAVTFLAVSINVSLFIMIDSNSHSVSDTMFNFFVYFTAVSFWWKLIAENTCKTDEDA